MAATCVIGLNLIVLTDNRWRVAGVVERDGLENRCMRKRTEGSNPSPSASQRFIGG